MHHNYLRKILETPIQKNNPLHGITLETMVTQLAAAYTWPELFEAIPIQCFKSNPSISSSLKFLRKTPWARNKVEHYYMYAKRKGRIEN